MKILKEIITIIFILMSFTLIMFKICEKAESLKASELRASNKRVYRVTAYCPCEKCCGKYADGRTASGVKAEGKIIAAPKEIPFGTWIFVPGYGWGEVLDRGGSIKGRRLDVFFPTHEEAFEWGVKYLELEI